MTRVNRIASTVGFCLASFVSTSALAQTAAMPMPAARPVASVDAKATHHEAEPTSAGESDSEGNFHPVLQVSSVEVLRSRGQPELDVIRVKGISSTEGWEAPQLIPLTHGSSGDGYLDMVFVAQAPGENTSATGFGTLEATFIIEPGHPYKGIRVHGAANAVSLTKLPGYVEAPIPAEDCKACEGKVFVAKGAAAPSARNGGAVREEDLPARIRVIKANEGVGKFDIDPNRLTLLLGENGVIVYAVWD